MSRIWRYQRERALRLWRMKRPFVALDESIRQQVAASGDDAVSMTRHLVDYLWQAQRHYLHRHGTLAYYPGWPSIYGATNDAIEGVTRLMPLWAAYAGSPSADSSPARDMVAALRTAVLHGTDPAHPGYWGDIGERSTLICEAADVALSIWLGRNDWWPSLDDAQRQQVLRWLGQAVGKRTADNNWHLFVVLVDAVLAALDPARRYTSDDRLDRVRQFARGHGCFVDGPNGQVDFYNAWGFHYLLFWLGEIDAARLDPPLMRSLGEFCRWYQWLFTARGLPLFGRSLCYRFAACAPLIACGLREPAIVRPGVALNAYLANWKFFVAQGSLFAGRPTQGVFGEDIQWLDPYSGPASSLWGTRSMVVFLYGSRVIDWQGVPVLPLPSDSGPSILGIPPLGARICVPEGGRECVVDFDPAQVIQRQPVAVRRTPRDCAKELIYARASRAGRNLRDEGLQRFSSALTEYQPVTWSLHAECATASVALKRGGSS